MEDKISKHIESKYKVIGVVPGKVVTKNNNVVDLRTISMEEADKLFNDGFPYLELVSKSSKNQDETVSSSNDQSGESLKDSKPAGGKNPQGK